jgi:hypothetical protein
VFLLMTDEDTALAPANLQPTVTNTETRCLHSTVLHILYCTAWYVHLTFTPSTVLYRLYMWALWITIYLFMLSFYNFAEVISTNSKSEYCLKGPSHQIILVSALEVILLTSVPDLKLVYCGYHACRSVYNSYAYRNKCRVA